MYYTNLFKATLRDAENRGFDVDTELPLLVTGRSFDDAEDIASVLHHRIDRYVTGVGYPSSPSCELVAGIFPRPGGIVDPDVVLALDDRVDDIEQRARELAIIAIERGDVWVREFGRAPETGELYEQWVTEVSAGAAYLECWKIDNCDNFLDDSLVNHEQGVQRRRVLGAAQRARALSVVEDVPEKSNYVLSGDGVWNPPTLEFALDR